MFQNVCVYTFSYLGLERRFNIVYVHVVSNNVLVYTILDCSPSTSSHIK